MLPEVVTEIVTNPPNQPISYGPLIAVSSPMRRSRLWIGVAVALAFIFAGCNGLAAMDYFCSECATDRREVQLCLPKNRRLVTLYGMETPTVFTAMKRAVEPGRCPHRWVFASGKGGGFIDAKGAESRRTLLLALHNLGVVDSASTVDPAGALELIRWTLRTDVSEELFWTWCRRSDTRPMDFDSEPTFRAWFDEFRPKAVSAPN
jgi:hypothetical protein